MGLHNTDYSRKKIDIPWIMVLLIFINNDTFFFAFNSSSFIVSIPKYFAIIICLILFIRGFRLRKMLPLRIAIPHLLVVLFVVMSGFHNMDNLNRTMATVIFATEGLLIAWNYSFDYIFEKFDKVMYFLALTSIFIWIIAEIVPGVITLFPLVSPNSARIHNLFIGGVFENYLLSGKLIRSNSIFWEAGVFQIYLNIALSYNLLICNKVNVKKCIFYTIAILTTFSTASVVTTLFLYGMYIFLKKTEGSEKNNKTKIAFLLISLLSIAIIYIGVDSVFSIYFNKVIQKGHGSTAMRFGSLAIGGYLAISNPVYGVGASHLGESFKQYMLEFGFVKFAYTYSFTNTLMFFAAAYGMIVGILFTIGTFRISRYYSESVVFRIAICLFFILLYVDESLNTSVWPWIIVFLGWSHAKAESVNTRS